MPTGEEGLHAYFVHSYAFKPASRGLHRGGHRLWRSHRRADRAGNIAGTQFHPEKSQALGLSLIANFLKWTP